MLKSCTVVQLLKCRWAVADVALRSASNSHLSAQSPSITQLCLSARGQFLPSLPRPTFSPGLAQPCLAGPRHLALIRLGLRVVNKGLARVTAGCQQAHPRGEIKLLLTCFCSLVLTAWSICLLCRWPLLRSELLDALMEAQMNSLSCAVASNLMLQYSWAIFHVCFIF